MDQVPPKQPEPAQTDSPPPRGGNASWLPWILAFLFILYPLSIGPAVKLHRAFPRTRPVIEALYSPIVAISDKNPELKMALRWYVAAIWRED